MFLLRERGMQRASVCGCFLLGCLTLWLFAMRRALQEEYTTASSRAWTVAQAAIMWRWEWVQLKLADARYHQQLCERQLERRRYARARQMMAPC